MKRLEFQHFATTGTHRPRLVAVDVSPAAPVFPEIQHD